MPSTDESTDNSSVISPTALKSLDEISRLDHELVDFLLKEGLGSLSSEKQEDVAMGVSIFVEKGKAARDVCREDEKELGELGEVVGASQRAVEKVTNTESKEYFAKTILSLAREENRELRTEQANHLEEVSKAIDDELRQGQNSFRVESQKRDGVGRSYLNSREDYIEKQLKLTSNKALKPILENLSR